MKSGKPDNLERYCLQCSYNLSHTKNHQCPECGYEFDIYDSSTYSSSPSINRRSILIYKVHVFSLRFTCTALVIFYVHFFFAFFRNYTDIFFAVFALSYIVNIIFQFSTNYLLNETRQAILFSIASVFLFPVFGLGVILFSLLTITDIIRKYGDSELIAFRRRRRVGSAL